MGELTADAYGRQAMFAAHGDVGLMPLRPRESSISVFRSQALAVVFRVIWCWLEAISSGERPELGKAWTERIKGMTVYGAEELKQLLSCRLFRHPHPVKKKNCISSHINERSGT